MSGVPANPGCVVPSIVSGSVMAGNGEPTKRNWMPVPGILKFIVSGPEIAFASVIACRSDPGPMSSVFVTVNVCDAACGSGCSS
jgi:hypothetical protein